MSEKEPTPSVPNGQGASNAQGRPRGNGKQTTSDIGRAWFSILYLLLLLGIFLWLLFDVWIGQYTLPKLVYCGPQSLFAPASTGNAVQLSTPVPCPYTERLSTPIFRLLFYTFIGGGLGGIVNGMRSFLTHYSERKEFKGEYTWKYIIGPWLGAALALFVYALLRSGVAVLGGQISNDRIDSQQVFAMFAVGMLAGYGARDVFIWLDAQVSKIFKVEQVKTPNLVDKTKDQAKKALEDVGLKLGETADEEQTEAQKIGKVIRQSPAADTSLATGSNVNVTLGKAAQVKVPDLTGKKIDEAKKALEDIGLKLGEVKEEPTDNSDLIESVINQSLAADSIVSAGSVVSITLGKRAETAAVEQVQVPDLKDMTREQAEKALTDVKLKPGKIEEEEQLDAQKIGKVIKQSPPPASPVQAGTTVDMTLGKAKA